MHGAIGYTWEHDLQLLYKRAKLDVALFGDPSRWNERIATALELVPGILKPVALNGQSFDMVGPSMMGKESPWISNCLKTRRSSAMPSRMSPPASTTTTGCTTISRRTFPTEFYNAMADGGWLGITTPEEYGGHGFGITEASILIQAVAESGGGMNAASAIHLSIFGMHPVIVHGSDAMKQRDLPRIVNGDLHVCFGVTEPEAGLDTTRITTFATLDGDHYVVNGKKVWISKAMESEKILLLTRTAKFEDSPKKTDGLTLFFTNLDREHIDVRPIKKMGRNAVSSNELFIDDLRIPVEDRPHYLSPRATIATPAVIKSVPAHRAVPTSSRR